MMIVVSFTTHGRLQAHEDNNVWFVSSVTCFLHRFSSTSTDLLRLRRGDEANIAKRAYNEKKKVARRLCRGDDGRREREILEKEYHFFEILRVASVRNLFSFCRRC